MVPSINIGKSRNHSMVTSINMGMSGNHSMVPSRLGGDSI